MQRLTMFLGLCAAAACTASTHSRSTEHAAPSALAVDPVRTGHADVDLTGEWATGSAGEPEAKQIVLHPQCNYSPGVWILEQKGDTVRAWTIAASWAKGTASTEPLNRSAAEGWVSGVDVTIGMSGARYLLRYDSTSGHLRGTLNGAPFWAVRVEIVRPERCIPVP